MTLPAELVTKHLTELSGNKNTETEMVSVFFCLKCPKGYLFDWFHFDSRFKNKFFCAKEIILKTKAGTKKKSNFLEWIFGS